MEPKDIIAITTGTAAGAALAESAEQVIAAAAASVAVYLLRWIIKTLKAKLTGEDS